MAKRHYLRQRNRIFKRQLNSLVECLPVTIIVNGTSYLTLAKYIGLRYSRGYEHGVFVFESAKGDPYLITLGAFYFDEPYYLRQAIPWNHVITVAANLKPVVFWVTKLPLFIQHPLCETRLLSVIQAYIH